MTEVVIVVFNGSDGSVGYRARADVGGLAAHGFGPTEKDALDELREDAVRIRTWLQTKAPLPEGYPKQISIEL